MILLRAFLLLLTWYTVGGDQLINIIEKPHIQIALESNSKAGLRLLVKKDRLSKVIAVIGRRAEVVDVTYLPEVVITFDHNTTLKISEDKTNVGVGVVLKVEWSAPSKVKLEDCINLGNTHWYGGPQQKRQYWPIENLVLEDYPYVTKEADNCAIAERYWLNSAGLFFYFDKKTPLFVDQNSIEKNAACFMAEIKPPYSNRRTSNNLRYTIGIFEDVRKAHEYAIQKFLGKPSGIPDTKMITYPLWSTWAKYKTNINHDKVLKYADEIVGNGFSFSQLGIDDGWEACYGSMTVDRNKFPDFTATVSELKKKGFRVTMWVHPFINTNCNAPPADSIEAETGSSKNESYFVASELHTNHLTSWWNDNGTTTSMIDVTKPEVRKWFISVLQFFKEVYDVDSFKFDAGESSWAPQISVFNADIEEHPNVYSTEYAKLAAQLGDMVEVRTGFGTQQLPIFVRMVDKDTYFTFDNGLPTLVTTLLQMNMNGYPLVMPDMIGGDGYSTLPTKELYIRWLQASTFMPSMQFSYPPWDYDKETQDIAKTFTKLHEKYAPEIIAACKRAVEDGSPVNPPIWWISPEDSTAHGIWDEFLLGETILVAPMLEHDSDERDIYLPVGTWLEQGDPERSIEGPTWLRRYQVPIDLLPYFVKVLGQTEVLTSK